MKRQSLALRWADNVQSCAVPALVYALVAKGQTVRVAQHNVAGLRAGDYWFEATEAALARVAASGLSGFDCTLDPVSPDGEVVRLPRIAIFCGAASAYPYYGYYAHALACLGLPFEVLDGGPVADGALDGFDLLMLPGGFETWGLDRNEGARGIDAEIRRFLARGGACIASCGGAFYLSSGRPHWLGLAQASPRYSHEYLQSGAGVISIELEAGPLARGCAPLLEMPYYHGPIYEAVRAPTLIAARFCALTMPARLPIDNPLDASRFEQEMAGRAALLIAHDGPARAVLFSPHPEMGDVLRKYVALDSYVAHYLPIRGAAIMEQTLDFYSPNDSPSFRLILNAIDYLLASSEAPLASHPLAQTTADEREWQAARDGVLSLSAQVLDGLQPDHEALGRLVHREIAHLRSLAVDLDLAEVAAPARGAGGALRVLQDAGETLHKLTQRNSASHDVRALATDLLAVELPLRFLEALARIGGMDTLS